MDLASIRQAERELMQKRLTAQKKADIRIQQLYEEHPELKALEQNKRALICDFSMEKAQRASAIKETEDAISRYLVSHHLTLPQPEYSCKLCNDTGYLPQTGQRCSCFTRRLVELTMKSDCALNTQTFECFDPTVYPPIDGSDIAAEMTKIKNYCQAYADSFPNIKYPNLLLSGNTGTGKTFLLNCIAARLRERSFSVAFITAGRLFDILRKYALNQISDIDALLEAELLIIDDFGTEPLFNNITVEYMFLLVNERTRLKKPLCLSTNLTPDKIKERYTERIASRLLDRSTSAILHVPGKDIRTRK